MTLRRTSALTLLALLAPAACKDSNGPESFDPMATSTTATQAFGAVQSNKAVQSLNVLGSALTFTGAAPPFAAAVPAALATLPLPLRALVGAATAFSPTSPAALFPQAALGKTFVYNPTTAKYEPSNPAVAGAPTNGVRFRLYDVDPVTRRVLSPLKDIGYLDLTDKSNSSAATLGITASVNNVITLSYDASGSVTTSSFTFTAKGYALDGANRVDFDLSQSLSTATGLKVDYKITAPNLSIHVVASGTSAGLSTVTLTVTQGSNNLEIAASGTTQTVSGTVKYNGTTLAMISGKADNPTFTGQNGRQLTTQDLDGLKQLFAFVDRLFSSFDDLLVPSYFVFGISK